MIEQDNLDSTEKVKRSIKASYGLTNLGSQLVHIVFGALLIKYYVEKMLLPEIWLIWAYIFFSIWNAVNDPLFGWLSDKTKTRWGRRIPYLFIFTPIMSISFILLWTSPSIAEIGEFGVFIYLLIFMCLYDTSFTATILAWSALGQEISMDRKERGSIQIYSLIFALIGTLPALFLPNELLKAEGREGFIFLTIIFAVFQLIAMEITTFKVKERLEFSHVDEPVGFIDSLKHTLKRKSFITTVTMNFFLVFIMAMFFGMLFFYTDYALPGYDSILILLLTIGLLLTGISFGTYYTDKINKKKGVKPAMINSIILFGIGFLLVGILPDIFGILGFFFVGVGVYGSMTLFNVAYGEVMDEDEVDTGIRREGAIMGMNALITKPAEGIGGAFVSLMLLLFLFQEPIGEIQQIQSGFTIFGIKLAIGIIPGLIAFLAALIFTLYPLHGDYLKTIKIKMFEMHEEKKEKMNKNRIERKVG